MKYLWINSILFSVLLTTVTTGTRTSLLFKNTGYSQDVDLITIQSGNVTLDNGLPEFYDCIDEKIDESKGVEVESYFEKEPTKNEVKTCYKEFLLNGSALMILHKRLTQRMNIK